MEFKIGQTVRIDGPYSLSDPGVVISRCFHKKTYEIAYKNKYQHVFVDEYFLVYLTPEESEVYDVMGE